MPPLEEIIFQKRESHSFRFDGEIKSFPDKAKVKRIQHHQTSFIANAKGISLGRKQEKKKT